MHAAQLDAEGIERIVEVASSFGVNKVKFTGGEPTLRRDIVDIVRRTRKHISGNISMTTNGVMLPRLARQLREAGLDRVNISMHSTEEEGFRIITGTNFLGRVKEGIRAAKEAGLGPIKVNFVVLNGINVHQIPAMMEFCAEEGVTLQLIEYETTRERMHSEEFQKYHVPLEPIEREIASRARAVEHNSLHRRPEYLVEVNGKDLWVEFVKPMRNSEFCNHCTRIRVTSTGELKPCLMRDDNHIDIKEALEKGDTDALRRLFIRAALSREPYWKPYEDPRVVQAPESF